MSVALEADRETRGDESQALEEIRQLFARYRQIARHGSWPITPSPPRLAPRKRTARRCHLSADAEVQGVDALTHVRRLTSEKTRMAKDLGVVLEHRPDARAAG